VKVACPVRRGADGKGRKAYLASRLPYVIEIIGTKVIVQSPVYPNIRIEVDNIDGKSMKPGFPAKVIITEHADNNLVKAKWAK